MKQIKVKFSRKEIKQISEKATAELKTRPHWYQDVNLLRLAWWEITGSRRFLYFLICINRGYATYIAYKYAKNNSLKIIEHALTLYHQTTNN